MASRVLRGLAWAAGIVVALLALAAAFLVFVFDWNWLRGPLGERAGGALGRGLAIAGDLDVDLGRVVHIRAEGVRIGNPPWTREPEMARLDALDVSVRLWPLLRGRVELPELVLIRPKIVLEKNRNGEANWQFGENPKGATAAKAALPQERSEFPVIERLVIEDGKVTYRDPTAPLDLEATITTATGGDPSHEMVQLSAQGTFKQDPARIRLEAGSLLTLRDADTPYPVQLDATIGGTRARVDGTILEPLNLAGLDLKLSLSGPDMADIFPIFGIPIPATAAYSITGQLDHRGESWTFRDFQGQVGDSDLHGGLTVVTGGERPLLRANLISERLALADLAGFIGAKPQGETPTTTPDRVLPDQPVNLSKLRAMNVDLRFSGKQVEVPGLPMEGLDAHLVVTDGLAQLDPLTFTIAQGSFSGTVALDGRQEVPRAELAMEIRRMDLNRFFAGTRFASESSGRMAGRLHLNGTGRSTADILAGADGRATLLMAGGSLSALLIEASGLDIAEALGFAASGDRAVPVRCLVADFDVQQGVVQSRALVLDTTDTLLTGQGGVDLAHEQMNLRIEAHPKDPSPFSARSPVEIGGTLKKPEVGVSAGEAAARAGIAAALGALLTPLAAIIPFLEPGLGEDSDCARLIQQAQSQ